MAKEGDGSPIFHDRANRMFYSVLCSNLKDKPDFIQRNVTKMLKSQENIDFQLKAEI